MTNTKIGLLSILFVGLLFGSLVMTSVGYSPENSITDTSGDETSDGSYSDILKVWVDNNATFITFQVELTGPWNLSMPNWVHIYAHISVDNATGTDWGWFTNFLFDYVIDFEKTTTGFHVNFGDMNNSANNLNEGESNGMAFYIISNNNCTVEFGWKINSDYGGEGNLPLIWNQQIYLKFYAGGDSDFAPDVGLEPMGYLVILPGGGGGGIPGFEFLLVGLLVLTIIALYSEKLRTI